MDVIKTSISDLLILKLKIFEDSRGYFFESYNKSRLSEHGLFFDFVQDNESKSDFGVVRGLHYQLAPHAQTKLLRVVEGKIWDVAVDLRRESPTFGKYFGVELSAENKLQFLVPKGFAHGFSVLSKAAVVQYKCDNVYSKSDERGFKFDDKFLNIDWKLEKKDILISEKDRELPTFELAEYNF